MAISNKPIGSYTEGQWQKEMSAPGVPAVQQADGTWFAFGAAIPCPRCGTVGFYGARVSGEGPTLRKYRACKFCGLWQEAFGELYDQKGGEAYRCIMVYCEQCNLYDWRLPFGPDLGTCNKCKKPTLREVQWPSDDPNHPFQRLKERMRRYTPRW